MQAFTIETDALLFDLDGVLVDSTESVESHWKTFASWYDLDADVLLTKTHGVPHSATIRRELAQRPESDVVAALARFEALEVEDATAETILPGAAELLDNLPKGRWAVVTSCWHELAIARAGAAGVLLPPILVTADQLKAGKPAPDGYLSAARQLGVDPSKCVVFEDAPSGVMSALGAGATPIVVQTTTDEARLREAMNGEGYLIGDLRDVSVSMKESKLVVTCKAGGNE